MYLTLILSILLKSDNFVLFSHFAFFLIKHLRSK
jgi:hypothetical protein